MRLWYTFLLCSVVFFGWAHRGNSHEMSPAYPKFVFSHLEGLMKTTVNIFNRRKDVSFFEIEVFDEDWNPLPFAAQSRLLQLQYLEKKSVNVYIRRKDLNRVEYVCTRSKIFMGEGTTKVSSKICSRVKNE